MSKPNKFDQQMTAVTFAEAGDSDSAKHAMNAGSAPRPAKHTAKKKPYLGMVIFGIMSMTAYAIVFTNERLVTQTYTMGGWYTVFPVATAFGFSFIHGAFASNLLSVLGLEAKK